MKSLNQTRVTNFLVEQGIDPITLHTDGTSKQHVPFITMLASTESGTYGIGLSTVEKETSETLLMEAINSMEQLLFIDDIASSEERIADLLLKEKNTMTDRCIINKKFELLEQWREKMLPQITSNWDQLSQAVKEQMTCVNYLYCGKHLVLNLQEYAGAALSDWETVESCGEKLGRERHLLWNRKESATMLCIRTVCEAFGPDDNEQAGCPTEFNDFLEEVGVKNELVAYRGNRFNVPFVNVAAVYYHHQSGHIKAVCDSLPQHKQKNQLIRSVKFDLQDKIILSGIRAMGIIYTHITLPLMNMLGSDNITIMETDKYYTKLCDSIATWMRNPKELLEDTAILFADFPPNKNAIHSSLYSNVDEEVSFLTEQAISIILHNLYICVSRQVEDHLP